MANTMPWRSSEDTCSTCSAAIGSKRFSARHKVPSKSQTIALNSARVSGKATPEWRALLAAACSEPVRNRLMLAFAYDCALRREELCSLATGDIDPARRLLRVRAETTKTRRERVVPYSVVSADLYMAYLAERRRLGNLRGPLFLSESTRNRAAPMTKWTWSKVVRRLAQRAALPTLTTHSFRHLCLTDLARAGWDIEEIASFAGHRSIQSTLLYIHLSARDLSDKFARSMAAVHEDRLRQLKSGAT